MKKVMLLSLLTTFIIGMIIISYNNFTLFHFIIEMVPLLVGILLFFFSTLQMKRTKEKFVSIIGLGSLLSGIVLFFHAVFYKNNGIVEVTGANQSTQLWILANLVLSVSILSAILLYDSKFKIRIFSHVFFFVTAALFVLIQYGLFPVSYVEGVGLTTFKVVMEYVIILIYFTSLYLLFKTKANYSKSLYISLIVVITLFIIAEFLFTQYANVFDEVIVYAHIIKTLGHILLFQTLFNYLVIQPLQSQFRDFSNEITNLENSISEVRKNERIFRTLYEDAPLGYQSLDENGKFIIVNETYAKLLGYSKNEMIGKYFGDFMDNESMDILPDKLNKFKQKGKVDVIFNMKHKNGKIIPVRFLGKIAYKEDGGFKQTHCILMNISDDFEYQKGIIKSKTNLDSMLQIMNGGVYTVNVHGICTSINDYTVALLGYKNSDELIGKSIHELIHHSNEFGEKLSIKNCEMSKTIRLGVASNESQTIFWKKDGSSFLVDYSTLPIIEGNSINGAVVFFNDVDMARMTTESIIEITYHDKLTGVFNRQLYELEIENFVQESNLPVSVIVCDINGLKLVNDAFGHKSGDELLIQAVSIFTSTARKNDLIARIGGDEFVILMPQTTKRTAEKLIESMHNKCKSVFVHSIQLSISFGVETLTKLSSKYGDIYKSAEDSMYRSKLANVPSMRSSAIETILRTLFEKDVYSEQHSRNVSKTAVGLARCAGYNDDFVNSVKTAALLHDIGKIIISTNILKKSGSLADYEYEEMKKHPEIGFRILNSTSNMRKISSYVLSHHERIDGTGYPQGLSGDEIPTQSKIITIADAYDAMITERTYKNTLTRNEALEELKRCSNTQFDTMLVDIFIENVDEILK